MTSHPSRLLITDAEYIQIIITSKLGMRNMDAHCKITFHDGIHHPECKGESYFLNIFCGHVAYLNLFYKIAGNTQNVTAYRDSKADQNGVEEPKQFHIGPYGEKAKGVFYANPEHPEKEDKSKKLKLSERAKYHNYRLILSAEVD